MMNAFIPQIFGTFGIENFKSPCSWDPPFSRKPPTISLVRMSNQKYHIRIRDPQGANTQGVTNLDANLRSVAEGDGKLKKY